MYYLYILFSFQANKYYIGHTSDLDGRLHRHNSNHNGYTGKWSDWKVVYTELYDNKQQAYQRERVLKSWKSKSRIKMLVSGSEHPDFQSGGS